MRRQIIAIVNIVVILLIMIVALPTVIAAGEKGGDYKPDEIVCRMSPGISIDIINQEYGTTVKSHQSQTDCYLLTTSPDQDAEVLAGIISNREDVVYCGANYYLYVPESFQRSQAFLDELSVGDVETQAAAVLFDFSNVRELATGAGIKVAVIDCGINFFHPEFTKTGEVSSGWDYIDGDDDAFDEPGGWGSGHGTFIAGIIRLVAHDSPIFSYRVLDTLGRGNGYDIASAILMAIEDSCRVINLSLGMQGRHDAIDDALRYAEQNEVIVTAAAGNDSTNQCLLFPYPAEKAYCIAVAALDSLNVKADFSNYGQKVSVCAPGTNIYAPYHGDTYAWWSGTSFSTPFVTGLAALLLSVNPQLKWIEVANIMAATAINVDSLNPELSGLLGAGLIDMEAAIIVASDFVNGDADGSGSMNIGDAVFLINYIFHFGPPPQQLIAGDANHDGYVNIGDVVYIIHCIFHSEPHSNQKGN